MWEWALENCATVVPARVCTAHIVRLCCSAVLQKHSLLDILYWF